MYFQIGTRIQSLPETVLFLLRRNFGRRGPDGWAELGKDTFTVAERPEGEEYVECIKLNAVKICRGYKQIDQAAWAIAGNRIICFKLSTV